MVKKTGPPVFKKKQRLTSNSMFISPNHKRLLAETSHHVKFNVFVMYADLTFSII